MGLLNKGASNHTCPSVPTGPQYGVEHVIGSFTFHDLTTILCGAFTAITFFISAISMFQHATHFSNPAEQVKIFRIIAIVPAFASIYFLSGAFLSTAIYLQPWADFYEAIALASYFLLLVTFLEPVPEHREAFFDSLGYSSGDSSLTMYRRTWVFVFQYIAVAFFVAIVTDITQAAGVYCANSSGLHFAHIWLVVIQGVSVALAFIRLLQFYKRSSTQLKPRKPLRKLAAIKGIVFLTFLQQVIFLIIRFTSAGKPSPEFSYNDLNYGVPSILVCGEMVLFALLQLYAYSAKPYYADTSLTGKNVQYYGGPMGIRAFMAAANPTEIVQGLIQMVKYMAAIKPAQRYDTAIGLEPLRYGQGGAANMDASPLPPSYPSDNAMYHGAMKPQREPSPNGMEYGTVNEYTPLPGRKVF